LPKIMNNGTRDEREGLCEIATHKLSSQSICSVLHNASIKSRNESDGPAAKLDLSTLKIELE